MSLKRRLIRTVFTFLNGLRLAVRNGMGRNSAGVHAVPVTADGKVVLVKLTYAPGWRVPGGGLGKGEAAEDAILRELREEIGLLSHGAIEPLEERQPGAVPNDQPAYFVVRDVVYRARRSLEVDEVREFDPGRLPEDTTPWTAHLVERSTGSRPQAVPPAAG